MKLVWENDRMTVTAKGLTSQGTCERVSPDLDRRHFEKTYPVCRVGAMELQRQAKEVYEARRQRKLQGTIEWLKNL